MLGKKILWETCWTVLWKLDVPCRGKGQYTVVKEAENLYRQGVFNIEAAHCPPPLCSAGGLHCPDVSQVIWNCFRDLTADLRAFSMSHNLWITP